MIEVHALSGKRRDMARFIAVPERLYARDPYWVAQLRAERKIHFGPRNPYFDHADTCFFLAWRDGVPVGRISAQIDRLAQTGGGPITGHFGLLEGADAMVIRRLLATAEQWLRDRGAGRVEGPYSLSINDEVGLLVDGPPARPRLLMNYAPSWYGPAVEAAGYEKVKDLLAYRLEPNRPLTTLAERLASQARQAPGITIRPLDRRRLRAELDIILDIFNDAWADNWRFVPMTEAEIGYTMAKLRPLIRPDLARIAEINGQPVAMIVAVPDLNEAIADLGGRLFPLGWAKLLWRLKGRGVTGARILLMGVRKSHRGSILGSVLSIAMLAALRTAGISEVELSWVLEDNAPMRRIIEAGGGTVHKRYRLYAKDIA